MKSDYEIGAFYFPGWPSAARWEPIERVAPERKPVWMWLQGTGYAYWMDREPTPRELSCMVYGSLLAGARGIYYFAQVPRTKACLDEMRAMCVEVDEVAPAIYSLEEAPAVATEAPGILCQSYLHEGRLWVLAVNTQNYKGALRTLKNRRVVRDPSWKRAIVTVKAGERIETV